MKLRVLLLTAVCLLASLADSLAGLRVISAFFGRPNKNEDVTRAVRNYVENGVFGFRISGQNLGAKEHYYKEDYLRVIYEVEFKEQGQNPTLQVAADGTLVQELQK